ncbi:unnamed protein product [Spodoptera exigua]|nr:unnamed protein product [Spodoptera exigua]
MQNALSRSQESAEAHEMRLSINRECHAKSRASETFTQQETRLSSQRNRTDVARSCESVEGRQARLESDRERHAESRAAETYTQREMRLSSQRSRTDAARSCESVEARQIRLESDRERHADSRTSETYTQREARLCLQRSCASFSRSIEDDEERETRLRRDRSQHALSRSLETDEQREERRAAARQRYHELLGDASTHLSQERDRIQEIRGTWSDEQRAAQVEQDRLRRNVNQLSTSDEESTVYDIEEQPWLNKEGSGFMYNVAINYAAYGNIDWCLRRSVCSLPSTQMEKGEPNGMCCASGKVRLDSMQDPPDLLRVLLNGEHPKSSHFFKNIRAYNSAFQMTSFGVNQIVEAGFMPTFKVQGQVYHQIGSLLPTDTPKFLQVYFISDFHEQANVRSRHIPNLDSGLVRGLQSMLHNVNPHIENFKAALASVPENERNRFNYQGKIAIAAASSGIAATLLPGGKTAHAMFKIPIDLESTETPVCGVSHNSDKGHVLKDCSLVVWDECTMANRKAVEAVDRTLQNIRRNEHLMGGVTVLFSGDFRQTLPVVTRGSRADEVNASLKRSALWSRVHTLRLTINMRAQLGGNARAQEFSDVLLSLGDGTLPEERGGQVVLPESLGRVVSTLDELIRCVYRDISRIPHQPNSWACERAILTPKNDQAAAINESILLEIEGIEVVYTSINTVVEQDDATHYPVEFLNSLTASGLPAHNIKLKFKRVQFPVSVCFAMTINKSQGQTLKAAGVDLRTSCFSHGQLYVACSRVTSPDSLYILATESKTTNVVYREIL